MPVPTRTAEGAHCGVARGHRALVGVILASGIATAMPLSRAVAQVPFTVVADSA